MRGSRATPGSRYPPRLVPVGHQPAVLDEPFQMLACGLDRPEAESVLHLAHRRRLAREQPIPHELEDLAACLARWCPPHGVSAPRILARAEIMTYIRL